jgi:FkbM family methyltransferase
VPGFVGSYPYCGVNVNYPQGAWIIDAACEQVIFESENAQLVSRMVRPNSSYYDIGANLGFLSIPVLQQNPDVKVISFEPSPSYLPYLSRTAKESIHASRWEVVGKAIGATVGQIEFGVGSVGKFDDMIANATFHPNQEKLVQVPITTIDEHWRTSGRPDVSFIKIDTEGAEFQGLLGAVECLEACRPFVLMECSELHLRAFGQTPKQVFEWIIRQKYAVTCLPNLIPVRTPDEFQAHLLFAYSYLLFPVHDD